MSFTQDELQAFNAILEQRLSAQRREMERSFDQRFKVLKHDFEQRIDILQQGMMRNLTPRFAEQQQRLRESLDQRLQTQETQISLTLQHEHEQLQQHQQSQIEGVVERALAAQLLAIEQLLSSHGEDPSLHPYTEQSMFQDEGQGNTIEAIEVQTEIPWDDVADMFNKSLDERMAALTHTLQNEVRHMEHQLLTHLRFSISHRELPSSRPEQESLPIHSIQELLQSIEQLEHIIESMQVAMTANHAFLSNRLFHHQHLPLERAHPATPSQASVPTPVSLSDLTLPAKSEN